MVEREQLSELERRPTHKECVGLLRDIELGFLRTSTRLPRITNLQSYSIAKNGLDVAGYERSVSLIGSRQPNARRVLFESHTQIDSMSLDELELFLSLQYSIVHETGNKKGAPGKADNLEEVISHSKELRDDLPIMLLSSYSLAMAVEGRGRHQKMEVTRTTSMGALQRQSGAVRGRLIPGIGVETVRYESDVLPISNGQLFCVLDADGTEPANHFDLSEVGAVKQTLVNFGLMKKAKAASTNQRLDVPFLTPVDLRFIEISGASYRDNRTIL